MSDLNPVPSKPAASTDLRERLDRLQQDPFWRLSILFAETAAVIAAIVALFLSIQQSSLAQQALLDQRLGMAWQIVSNEDSYYRAGKRFAVATMLQIDREIIGIPLGCHPRAIAEQSCASPPSYRGMTFGYGFPDWQTGGAGARGDATLLSGVSFLSADLTDTKFENIWVSQADFGGAKLSNTEFTRSSIVRTTFENADLRRVKFHRSDVRNSSFRGARLYDANIVSTSFVETDLTEALICLEVDKNKQPVMHAQQTRFCEEVAPKILPLSWFIEGRPPRSLSIVPPDTNMGWVCPEGTTIQTFSVFLCRRLEQTVGEFLRSR